MEPSSKNSDASNRTIIVVTPTYKRITRLPDMIRLANTLAHVKNLHWIVVEDGYGIVPAVRELLEKTNLSYTYMAHKTAKGYPTRGWYQRTMALRYIRSSWSKILREHDAVVYFADDDNAYDVRLFTDYIRNVNTLGVWAVGLVGGAIVEAPKVVNHKVTGFNVRWSPNRRFAVDMAGFAINLKYILNSDAVFGKDCKRGEGAPETCLIEDIGLDLEDIEPFGYDATKVQDIMVWHTKTSPPEIEQRDEPIDSLGYFVEY